MDSLHSGTDHFSCQIWSIKYVFSVKLNFFGKNMKKYLQRREIDPFFTKLKKNGI